VRRDVPLFFPLLAFTLGAAACAAKKEEDPFATPESYCAARAAAECAHAADACLAPRADCEGARRERCMAASTAAVSLVRPYRSSNVGLCLDSVSMALADGKLTREEQSADVPGSMAYFCERVFDGTAGKAQTCASSLDCQPGLVCGRARASAELRCAAVVAKKLGDECANAGDACERGTFCGARAICEPLRAKDAPCSDADPCGERLRCDATSGRCVDRLGIGGVCVSHGDCLPEAPYCLPLREASQCAKDLTLAPGVPGCRDYGKP